MPLNKILNPENIPPNIRHNNLIHYATLPSFTFVLRLLRLAPEMPRIF